MSRYMTPPFGDFYSPGRGRGFGNSYALPMTPRGISRMQPIGYGMDQGFGGYGGYGMDRGYGGYGIGRGGFDMSRIYEGLPVPGYIPGYGEVGGETDYGFYPQDTGGGDGGGEETEEQRRARQIRENEEEGRRTYGGGSEPADRGISSGRGQEVGSFGDWAGRMAEMARDVMQGAYQGDSSYGAGPGTGPAPGAPEPAPGGYSGDGLGGDYANGGIARRRYQDGGGADAGGAGDVRGQGGDQASYPDLMSMLNDPNFRGDWGKVLDMATVGPTRGFLEVSGLADSLGIGGGYGAVESAPVGEISDSDRGASMAARGGSIHYASGGGGGGREGDPRTETTEEASDAVYRWLKSFGLRPSKENIEIAEMAVYGTPPAKSNAAPDLGGGADRQEERGIGRDNRIETRELPPLPRMTAPAPTAALLGTLEGRSPDRRMQELIEEERSSLYPSYAGIAEFPGAGGIGRPMSGVDYGSMSNADLIKLIRFPQDPGIRLEAEAELKRRKLERRAPMRASGGGIGYAVGGPGDGRADKIPAMLSDGEHIIPADVVSGLGRGSSKAGHEKLNQMILKERAKYRKTLGKLPPPKD